MKNKIILSALLVLFVNFPLINASDSFLAFGPQLSAPAQASTQLTPPSDPNAPLDPALAKEVNASQVAAEAWLKIVDQGSYGNSWDAAALPLRLTMTRKEWISSVQAMRKSMGHLVERKVADIRLAQNPKNLARGNYMVFIFQTSFSSGHVAREILTLQQSGEGQWRVLTYMLSQLN